MILACLNKQSKVSIIEQDCRKAIDYVIIIYHHRQTFLKVGYFRKLADIGL